MSKNKKTFHASVRTVSHFQGEDEPEWVDEVGERDLIVFLSWCFDWCTEEDYETDLSEASKRGGGYEAELLAWDVEQEAAEQAAYLTWRVSVV